MLSSIVKSIGVLLLFTNLIAASIPEYSDKSSYSFSYDVKDPYSGQDFGHQEARYDDVVKGEYHVLLPDDRMQVVRYKDEGYGFVADVEYSGGKSSVKYSGGSYGKDGDSKYPSSGSAYDKSNSNIKYPNKPSYGKDNKYPSYGKDSTKYPEPSYGKDPKYSAAADPSYGKDHSKYPAADPTYGKYPEPASYGKDNNKYPEPSYAKPSSNYSPPPYSAGYSAGSANGLHGGSRLPSSSGHSSGSSFLSSFGPGNQHKQPSGYSGTYKPGYGCTCP